MKAIYGFIYALNEFIRCVKMIIRRFIYRSFKKRDLGKTAIALYNKDGMQLSTYTTDNNGKILIPNLEIGSYIISEIPPSCDTDENWNKSGDKNE